MYAPTRNEPDPQAGSRILIFSICFGVRGLGVFRPSPRPSALRLPPEVQHAYIRCYLRFCVLLSQDRNCRRDCEAPGAIGISSIRGI